jgi:hypothetical protein
VHPIECHGGLVVVVGVDVIVFGGGVVLVDGLYRTTPGEVATRSKYMPISS